MMIEKLRELMGRKMKASLELSTGTVLCELIRVESDGLVTYRGYDGVDMIVNAQYVKNAY